MDARVATIKVRPKALREALGWSQAEMADYLGCDQSTVSRIEKGKFPPSGPVRKLLEQLSARQSEAA